MKYYLIYKIPEGAGLLDMEEFETIEQAQAFVLDFNIVSFRLIRGSEVLYKGVTQE